MNNESSVLYVAHLFGECTGRIVIVHVLGEVSIGHFLHLHHAVAAVVGDWRARCYH